jgi:hypothetical protein
MRQLEVNGRGPTQGKAYVNALTQVALSLNQFKPYHVMRLTWDSEQHEDPAPHWTVTMTVTYTPEQMDANTQQGTVSVPEL